MAKIILRGGRNPIEIDNQRAKEIKKDWLNSILPRQVDVGTAVFLSSEIKSIEGLGEVKNPFRYDLNNSSHKQEIKDFEKEFLSFCKENPSVCDWKDRIFIHLKMFEKLGAIKIFGDPRKNNYSVINPKLCETLFRKFGALQVLRWLRERARRLNQESCK